MNKMTWEELVAAGQAKRDVWVVWQDLYLCVPTLIKLPFPLKFGKELFDQNEKNWAFYTNYWCAWADLQKRKQAG
jgi:hypothetical protein